MSVLTRMRSILTHRPRYARSLISWRFASLLARIAPSFFGHELNAPFFIIGCPRSGTTLLIDTLSAHKEIATYPGEANERWHPQTFPWRDSPHLSEIPPLEVDPISFTELSLKHRSSVEERRLRAIFGSFQFVMGRKCFLTKSAMITLMTPYILDQFPQAKFIHIIRDGRGVARSWAKMLHGNIRENGGNSRAQHSKESYEGLLENCANSWMLQIQQFEKDKRELSLEERGLLLEIRYEDFCQNPHDQLIHLADFMDVSPNPFRGRVYDHIVNMNYKFEKEFTEMQLRRVTQIMEPALSAWKYA